MTPVSPSFRPAILSEGGGWVDGAGREGEKLPAEGVETQGKDGGNAEAMAVHRRALPSPYMPTLYVSTRRPIFPTGVGLTRASKRPPKSGHTFTGMVRVTG